MSPGYPRDQSPVPQRRTGGRRCIHPQRLSHRTGHPDWFRQGAARAATTALLQGFDEHEIDVVDVHSGPSAQPIYSSLGFNDPTSRPMRRKRKDVSGAG